MEYYTTKHASENCARCGGEFTCKPNDISQCDCMKVRISPEEQDFISSKALKCVCNGCLKELKLEYYQEYKTKVLNQNV